MTGYKATFDKKQNVCISIVPCEDELMQKTLEAGISVDVEDDGMRFVYVYFYTDAEDIDAEAQAHFTEYMREE